MSVRFIRSITAFVSRARVLIAIMSEEGNHVVVHIISSTLTEHYVSPHQL